MVLVYNWGWESVPDLQYPFASERLFGWEEFGSKADTWLEEARIELDTPALSAAISLNGQLLWAGATGYADIRNRTEVSVDTLFRIGSSSKAVTAIAMGVLMEEGVLDLDAPVSKYISDLSLPLSAISTRQAMSHTGGVRDYGVCLCFPIWEYYNRVHYDSQRAALRPFEKFDLLFVPGQDFFYTSYGYNITGAVLESVAGSRFDDFLEAQVFAPLGLDGIRVDNGAPEESDATFYELREGSYKKAFDVDNTNKLPSGGILASPSSMVRLGEQMITPSLFGESTRDSLVQPQALANGQPNPQRYALGWRRSTAKVGGIVEARVFHHHGVAYGAVSHFAVYPDYGVVVSVLMNKNQANFGDVPDRLVDMLIHMSAE